MELLHTLHPVHMSSLQPSEFIAAVLPGAMSSFDRYHVLPSLTIAQAILESGWGRSTPGDIETGAESYNLFGIKWNDNWPCGYVTAWTNEWYQDVGWRKEKARFRRYYSFSHSVEDHGALMQLHIYSRVLDATDGREAAKRVWEAGYATDPGYVDKLVSIMEAYELLQYDRRDLDYEAEKAEAAGWCRDLGLINDWASQSAPINQDRLAVILHRFDKHLKGE